MTGQKPCKYRHFGRLTYTRINNIINNSFLGKNDQKEKVFPEKT
ncbi:hypothetical protein HMPREF1548_02054 [Clostridium sp. KLE 1755]|nr:hypothetical protein HMPREF1548_02054 [Clostridium sp. KLE 1755]